MRIAETGLDESQLIPVGDWHQGQNLRCKRSNVSPKRICNAERTISVNSRHTEQRPKFGQCGVVGAPKRIELAVAHVSVTIATAQCFQNGYGPLSKLLAPENCFSDRAHEDSSVAKAGFGISTICRS